MKIFSENQRLLVKKIWKYADLLLDKKYFARLVEYILPGTKDKDAFFELCSEAGIPENIPGFDQNLHEYLWRLALAFPPIFRFGLVGW